MRPRLIATDLDGTLLRSDLTLSRHTRAVLAAADGVGWPVIAISGRQPFSIRHVVDGTPLLGWCVGSNGSVAMDLRTGDVLFEETVVVAAQQEIAARMRDLVPGVLCASLRDAGRVFVPEHGYTALMRPGDHGRPETDLPEYDLADVLAAPSLKLVMRHPQTGADELLRVARGLAVPGVHPSTSGAPFLEVAAGGVTKATGTSRLATHLGFSRDQVMAFGDNRNDVELLRWAGTGVAVGNALPEAVAAADQVTAGNDEDGVALVLERLLPGQVDAVV